MDIKDLEITYMGRKCTIYDYVKYRKDISKCDDLEKVGALVYIHASVNSIKIPKSNFTFDGILEYLQFNMDKCLPLLIKVIVDKKISDVPEFLPTLFESTDDDEKYDLFLMFLKKCKI